MQDKRDELYDNLINSGKVSDAEIGSREEFKNAITDEGSSRQFYQNLIGSGIFDEGDLGTEDAFYNSIYPDFSGLTGTSIIEKARAGRANNETISRSEARGLIDAGIDGAQKAFQNTYGSEIGAEATTQRNLPNRKEQDVTRPIPAQQTAVPPTTDTTPAASAETTEEDYRQAVRNNQQTVLKNIKALRTMLGGRYANPATFEAAISDKGAKFDRLYNEYKAKGGTLSPDELREATTARTSGLEQAKGYEALKADEAEQRRLNATRPIVFEKLDGSGEKIEIPISDFVDNEDYFKRQYADYKIKTDTGYMPVKDIQLYGDDANLGFGNITEEGISRARESTRKWREQEYKPLFDQLDAIEKRLRSTVKNNSGLVGQFSDERKAQAALREISDIREMINEGDYEAAKKRFDRSDIWTNIKRGLSEAWRGLKSGVNDDGLWSFGVTSAFDEYIKNKAVKKYTNNENLSDIERDILTIDALGSAFSEIYKQHKPSIWYNVNKGIPQTLEFMLTMGRSGGKGITDAVGKSLIKKGSNISSATSKLPSLVKSVSKYGAETISNIAGSILESGYYTLEYGVPNIVADAYRRQSGTATFTQNGDGMVEYAGRVDGKSASRAAYESIFSNWLESYTEMMWKGFKPAGEAITKAGKRIAKPLKDGFYNMMSKVGLKDFRNSVFALPASDIAKQIRSIKQAGEINNFVEENLEEHVNNILNAAFVGDMNFSTDRNSRDWENSIFNERGALEIALSVSLVNGAFAAIERAGDAKYHHKLKEHTTAADVTAKHIIGKDWKDIKDAIDISDVENINGVLQKATQSGLLKDRKAIQAAANYASAKLTMQGYDSRELINALQQADEEKQTAPNNEQIETNGPIVPEGIIEGGEDVERGVPEAQGIVHAMTPYEQGVSMDADARIQAKRDFDAAETAVKTAFDLPAELSADELRATLFGDTSSEDAIERMEASGNYTPEQIQAVKDFDYADTVMSGVYENAETQQAIDEAVAQRYAEIDAQTGSDGNIHPVKLVATADGTIGEAFITDPEVTFNSDGTVNAKDGMVIVTLADGTTKPISVDEIATYDELSNAEELKQIEAENITAGMRDAEMQRIEDAINADVIGMTNVNGATGTANTPDTIDTTNTSASPAGTQQPALRHNAFGVPMKEDNTPDYEAAPAEAVWNTLTNESDEATASTVASTMASNYQKQLDKAKKKQATGNTPQEIMASAKANKEEVERLTALVEHWNNVAAVPSAMRQTGAPVTDASNQQPIDSSVSRITNTPDTGQINGQENEGGNGNSGTVIDGRPRSNRRKAPLTPMQQRERALGDYLDFYDYVERMLAASGRGLKVIWGDDPVTGTRGLGAHLTGKSESERRQYIWLLGTKKNGAFYPEQLAEELWQGYREERNDNGLPIDDIGNEQASDAFGVVLDVLRSHNRKEGMMREAEERHSDMQRQYDEAERDQANNWAIGQGYKDIDEWQADYEQTMEHIKEIYADYEAQFINFAEEYADREWQTEQDYNQQRVEELSRDKERDEALRETYEQENDRRSESNQREGEGLAGTANRRTVRRRDEESPAVVRGEQEISAENGNRRTNAPARDNQSTGVIENSPVSLGAGTGEGREVGRSQSGNLPASVAPLVADLERQSDERDALHQAWLSGEINDSENRQRLRALDEQMSELRRRIMPLLSSLSQEELNAISAYGEEHQLVELPTFVEDEERRRKVAKTEADRFAEGLEAQGSIPHGKAVAKFKASDFAAKDSTHTALGGTYYDPDGYAVTTDGFVLIADKQRYDPTKEGKVVAERNIPTVAGKGMEINAPYPNWKAVIPTGGQRVSVDWNDLLGFIAGVRAKMKVEYDELRERGDLDKTSFRAYTANATVQVRLPNGEIALFDLNRLERMAAAGAYLGTTELQYKGNDRAVLSANANGTALVMPMNRIPDEATSYYYDLSGSDMVGEPTTFYNTLGGQQVVYQNMFDAGNGETGTNGQAETAASSTAPVQRSLFDSVESQPQAEAEAEQPTTEPSEQAEAETTQVPSEPQQPKPARTPRGRAADRIEDFGEKIGGARKDVVRARIQNTKKLTVKDLKALKKGPDDILSLSNIQRLYNEGQMDEATARSFMAYNNVVKLRLKNGTPHDVEMVLTRYRDAAAAWEEGKPFSFDVTDDDIRVYLETFPRAKEEQVREGLDLAITLPFNDFVRTYEALNYPAEDRRLGRYVIVDYTKYPYRSLVGRPYWVKNGHNAQRGYPSATFEGAVEKLKTLCPVVRAKEKKAEKGESAGHSLSVVQGERGGYYIKSRNIPGKIYLSRRFWTRKEAEDYLAANLDALIKEEDRMTEALMGSNIGMAERAGVDYRNGRDVTPQDFLDEFGFRGVEFGNWVPQAERQMYLNKSYDAIKDLCAIIGISPRAFSLGGRLGLAFGARGRRKALAHYEPDKEVINLTRMKGVGSLAHEWFHAIDNYLSRQKTGNISDFATETRDTVRREVGRVFDDLNTAMRALDYHRRSQRAGTYWGQTVEEFARLFEGYIYDKLTEKGLVSPILVRPHVLLDDMPSFWPYPSREENAVMRPLFDRLFDTIQEKTDANGNVMLQEPQTIYNTLDGQRVVYQSLFEGESGNGNNSANRASGQALADEIGGMSDAQLLGRIGESGANDRDFYADEYDRRHEQEYDDAQLAYAQQLEQSNTSLDDAYGMYGDVSRRWLNGGYATDERTALRAQMDALTPYIDFLETERFDEEMEAEREAEREAAKQQYEEQKEAVEAFDPTTLRLRKLEPGETCRVERVYEETGQFNFTGKEKIESAEDVAFIFKQLETASVENAFLVLLKDGRPTIVHLGMGSYNQTAAPFETAFVAYQALKPDTVYFVHNHPSGNLKASRLDQEMLNRVKRAFGEDVVQQGIIIDTTSGNYGEFESIETSYETYSVEEEMPQATGNEIPIKVYQFSKQVFAPDWNPAEAFKADGSLKVAQFVSSHRLGEHKKMSLLVVTQDMRVVANVFLPWTKLSEIKSYAEAGDLLAGYVHQCGGVRCILYGNYDYTKEDDKRLSRLSQRMKQLQAPFLEVMHIGHSAFESGLLGEPETAFNEGSEEIFNAAKEKFGRTYDIREAGYVLPDGTMLDFSGRHELFGADDSTIRGSRATDHRVISTIAYKYDNDGNEIETGIETDMPDFIKRGGIRIDDNAGTINLAVKPTPEQREVLRRLIQRNDGNVSVDFGDGWDSDHYVEYEGARPQSVLADIDRYFDEGIKPEGNVTLSEPEVDYNAVNEPQYQLTGSEDVRPATQEEREETAYMADHFNAIGIPTSTDWEEGQRVLDMANGKATLSRAQKRVLETVSVSSSEEHLQTVVSSTDGAKVINNLNTLAKEIEKNEQTPVKTFLGEVAKAINAKKHGSGSQYATFETKSGKIITIRLADHNATVSTFDYHNESDGVSIVVSPKKNNGVVDDGNAHVTEFYYNSIKLRRAEGKPLAEIVRSIEQSLYSGEYKDTTGLAEVQEVNANPQRPSYQKANVSQAVFVSNARRAVEGIRQEKATPEQWLAMLQKQGGLKAGEDKWLGLSDWLKGQDKKSLTKQEVLDFIDQNQIQIEEVNYSEGFSPEAREKLDAFKDEYQNIVSEIESERRQAERDIEAFDSRMSEKYGYGWYDKLTAEERAESDRLGGLVSGAPVAERAFDEMVERYGDDFRYAFEYQDLGTSSSLIPQGDLYGDLTPQALYFLDMDSDSNRPINNTRLGYTTEGLDNKREIALTVPTIEPWNEGDAIHFGDAGEGRAVAWIRFGETTDADGNRTLVIDEIQSKRHQEGREKGYRDTKLTKRIHVLESQLDSGLSLTDEEAAETEALMKKPFSENEYHIHPDHTWLDITEDKWQYHAAFAGKVYDVGKAVVDSEDEAREYLFRVIDRDVNEHNRSIDLDFEVPDAPFDKNWHELAMKRMLRYAAENGYDKVAWTTGEQQAERYSLSKAFDSVEREDNPSVNGRRFVFSGRNVENFVVDDEGKVIDSTINDSKGKNLSELVGKDMAVKLMALENGDIIEDGLRIGGEGMKGFYDQMLPRFMDKYGKKWGAKVGEVELPDIGDQTYRLNSEGKMKRGLSMWSVDVTPEMKRDVMQGQPMFHRVYHGSAADFDRFDHSHMGEGEGAQAFGWGTYVTEVKGIGKTYAEQASRKQEPTYKGLSPAAITSLGDYVNNSLGVTNKAQLEALAHITASLKYGYGDPVRMIRAHAESIEDRIKRKEREARRLSEEARYESGEKKERLERRVQRRQDSLAEDRALLGFVRSLNPHDFEGWTKKYNPTLYTVEIPEDKESCYIDYTAKMRDQQDILAMVDDYMSRNEVAGFKWKRHVVDERIQYRAGNSLITLTPNQSGADLYEEFSVNFGPQSASEILHRAGITGIKYPAEYTSGGRDDNAKNYVIFDENDLQITEKIKLFRTPDGQAYGFTLNGKIYLDPRIATAETPIHEYGHLWVEALAEANPEAWEHLKGELEQDAGLVNYVKGRYPDLEGNELWEEVFTHFSGRRGRERMEEERRRMMNEEPDLMGKARVARMFYRLRRALKRFWTMARDLFAGNNARLKTMKAEDFADAMMADLVHGFNPRTGELAEQRIRRMADKYVPRYQFVGERGARQADLAEERTHRIDNLTVAREMEDAGKDAVAIKLATGWERGGDGKWRYEIPDIDRETVVKGLREPIKAHRKAVDDMERQEERLQGQAFSVNYKIPKRLDSRFTEEEKAKYRQMREKAAALEGEALSVRKEINALKDKVEKEGYGTTLGDVLGKGSELIKAYPSLADVKVKVFEHLQGKEGSYSSETNTIELNAGERSIDSVYSTMLHEIQHAIQHIEGFARGGNLGTVLSDNAYLMNFRDNLLGTLVEVEKQLKETRDQLAAQDFSRYTKEALTSREASLQLDALNINHTLDDIDNNRISLDVADRYYRRLGGEVEARNVQRRRGYSEEERRRSLAVATEDVGRDEQHFLFGDDESKSTVDNNKEGETLFAEKDDKRQGGVSELPARELAEKLNLGDRIEFVIDTNTLTDTNADNERRMRRSKGFFDTNTGKIIIVLPNHTSEDDVLRTVLHESVAHYGLRELFKDDFDTFLDNVYNNVPLEIKARIRDYQARRKCSLHEATEEYLASLAEDTNFEQAEKTGVWPTIKHLLITLLRSAHVRLPKALSDEDLRYILWRSFDNLRTKGRPNIIDRARDITTQSRLGVRNFTSGQNNTNQNRLFRDADELISDDKVLARAMYEERLKTSLFQITEALQDSMLGLKEAYRAIASAEGAKDFKIEDIPSYENAYLAENALSSVNKAEMDAYAEQVFRPLMDEVARLAKNKEGKEQLIDYLMAKHGLERNRVMAQREFDKYQEKHPSGKKTLADFRRDYAGLTAIFGEEGDTLGDIERKAGEYVDNYENQHDTDELWERIREATRYSVYKSFTSGIINKKTFDEISNMYEYYIPLRGFDEATSDEIYTYLNGRDGVFNAPIRSARGRVSKADDPLATIKNMADSGILQGNRNLMKQKFLNYVMRHPSNLASVHDLWLKRDDVTGEWTPVFPDVNPNDTPEEVERKVNAFEERMIELQESDPTFYKRGHEATDIPFKVINGNMKEHQVLVKRNGRNYVITINGNPRAAQALNGQTNPDNETTGAVGAVLRAGEWINRQLSTLYTTKNPDFIASNFLRDAIYANSMTWVKESPAYAAKFHANFIKFNPITMGLLFKKYNEGRLDRRNKTERYFAEFMHGGGETGYSNLKSVEQQKREIDKELKRANGKLSVTAGLRLLGKKLDDVNRAVENCARFAAFVTSREDGRDIPRSVWDAKEISVNFNKKGAGAKFYGEDNLPGNIASLVSGLGRASFVFWNAAVQGTANITRYAKRHPAKFAAAAATLFVLGALIPAMAGGGGDDDDKNAYFNLPEYVRRSNIMFRLGEQWLSIPLPIEYRAIYGLGELLMSAAQGQEDIEPRKMANKIASQLSQVLPLDFLEGGGGLNAFVPSWVKPIVEVGINKSWTGLPIAKETPFNKDMPAWTKTYKNTDQNLISLAASMNEATGGDEFTKGWADWNPAKLEYLLNGYLGGISNTIEKLAKTGETMVGKRDFDWRDVLIVNRVIKTGDERTAFRKANEKYYTYKEEFDKFSQRLRGYKKRAEEGDQKYLDKLDELNNSKDMARYEIFKEYDKKIAKLKKRANNLTGTDEEKEAVRELNREKLQLVEAIDGMK